LEKPKEKHILLFQSAFLKGVSRYKKQKKSSTTRAT